MIPEHEINMTLEYRCSNCGALLQTTNADPLDAEIERLRPFEDAYNKLTEELQALGEEFGCVGGQHPKSVLTGSGWPCRPDLRLGNTSGQQPRG